MTKLLPVLILLMGVIGYASVGALSLMGYALDGLNGSLAMLVMAIAAFVIVIGLNMMWDVHLRWLFMKKRRAGRA